MFFRKRLKKYDKKDEEKLKKELDEIGGLEKKDLPAMLISALLVILPACLLVLAGISLLALWLFGAL